MNFWAHVVLTVSDVFTQLLQDSCAAVGCTENLFGDCYILELGIKLRTLRWKLISKCFFFSFLS